MSYQTHFRNMYYTFTSFRAFWNDENKLLPQSFCYWKNFDKHIEHLFEEKSILTAKKTAKRIRTTRLGANKWSMVMHSYGFCWTTNRVLVFNNTLSVELMDRRFSQENHYYRLVYKTTWRTVHYIWFTICTGSDNGKLFT